MSIAELQSAISGCDMPTKLKLVEMLMGDIYSDTDFSQAVAEANMRMDSATTQDYIDSGSVVNYLQQLANA